MSWLLLNVGARVSAVDFHFSSLLLSLTNPLRLSRLRVLWVRYSGDIILRSLTVPWRVPCLRFSLEMAANLCCTKEQRGGSSSPDLPNARTIDATLATPATQAKQHLLSSPPSVPESCNSPFTSTRTDELHELREIFNGAKDSQQSPPPLRSDSRVHLLRRSGSLQKIKTAHTKLKWKFSKELSGKDSKQHLKRSPQRKAKLQKAPGKKPQDGQPLNAKVAKADLLRKDLLSDKSRDEGGYDSDAQILDDIAKKIGKRTPSKRTSLHSIEWSAPIRYVTGPENSGWRV